MGGKGLAWSRPESITLERVDLDVFSKEKRSEIMSRISSKNTSPEVLLRRCLWKKGLRYRIHYGVEKIDIAFPSVKLAVFVDGCFWHMCPAHGILPKSNRDYWLPKLKRNVSRAREKDRRLERQGWTVLHLWEHDLKEPRGGAEAVIAVLKRLGAGNKEAEQRS